MKITTRCNGDTHKSLTECIEFPMRREDRKIVGCDSFVFHGGIRVRQSGNIVNRNQQIYENKHDADMKSD